MEPASAHLRHGALAGANGSITSATWLRLLEVMERLALSRDLSEVLTLINDSMRDCLNAERASVFRYDAERNELYAEHAHGVGETLRFPADSGLAGQAVITKRIINVPDCYADARFNPEVDRRTGFRTRAMLSVPLASLDGKLEGVAQVLNKRGGAASEVFNEEDELIARALASQAAVAIRRAELLEGERRKAKMQRDLEVARVIQAATRPTDLPRVAGYTFDAWNEPAEETAGDCFDLVKSRDAATGAEVVWMLVADAAGHGVGPALAAAQAQAMFRMGVHAGLSLETLLTTINAELCEKLPVGMFVCAFVGALSTTSHTLRYAAAGLFPIVRARGIAARTVELLDATMAPLGIDREINAGAIGTMEVGVGEAVVVMTDGVYEQPSAREERVSARAVVERVMEGLASGADASGVCERLREVARAHRGEQALSDDQTAIAVVRMG